MCRAITVWMASRNFSDILEYPFPRGAAGWAAAVLAGAGGNAAARDLFRESGEVRASVRLGWNLPNRAQVAAARHFNILRRRCMK